MSERTISLADKKEIIIDFLTKCNTYSDQMLKKYGAQLEDISDEELLEVNQKIYDWKCYKVFNEYALGELEGAELDDWF
ncbi:MAG: hypothetical protein COB26_06305 [Piscirickettsiaceae bacterium]|nr:MAG: hypothetical protein COB26_06305 [Piscirickettsiaceae bacterium]